MAGNEATYSAMTVDNKVEINLSSMEWYCHYSLLTDILGIKSELDGLADYA